MYIALTRLPIWHQTTPPAKSLQHIKFITPTLNFKRSLLNFLNFNYIALSSDTCIQPPFAYSPSFLILLYAPTHTNTRHTDISHSCMNTFQKMILCLIPIPDAQRRADQHNRLAPQPCPHHDAHHPSLRSPFAAPVQFLPCPFTHPAAEQPCGACNPTHQAASWRCGPPSLLLRQPIQT